MIKNDSIFYEKWNRDMMSESNVDEIFKPIPVNDEGKPIKGYSIYIEGELPKFLLNE